jgi:uncharacterized membrane protein
MVRGMSPALLGWIETAHVFGVILWVAGIFACLRLLRAHAAGAGSAAADTARSTAILMDIGATVALAAGLTMVIGMQPTPLREGWMHPKLLLVVLGVISIHGLTRAKIKKARRGESAAMPSFVEPAAIAVVALIVALAVAKPM